MNEDTPTVPMENIQVPIIENLTKSYKKRPRYMNARKKAMVEALTEELGIVTSACMKVKLSRETHYQWMKDDPDYKQAVEAIEARKEDVIEKAFLSLVIDKNPAAVIHAVKTKLRRKGYNDVQQIEHSGGAQVQFNIIEKSMQEIQDAKLNSKSEADRNAQSTGR